MHTIKQEPKSVIQIKAVLVVFLLFSIYPCFAQEFEKNGFPCVAELCLGDGLADLSKVHWDRAKHPSFIVNKKIPLYTSTLKLRKNEIEILKNQFRGDVELAAPFLKDKLFDSGALASLSRVTAACAPNELTGAYTTQTGNPTRVNIALRPNQTDTTKHQWTVVSIVRTFPAAISNEQRSEIESQLSKRYEAFDAQKTKNVEPGEGRFYGYLSYSFGFHLSLFRGIDEGDRMTLHPACGGTQKVNID